MSDRTVQGARGEPLIIEIRGAFDLELADRLRQPLFEALEGVAPLVAFDLCDCTYVDSTALGLISDAYDLVRDRSGAVALICPDAAHPARIPLRLSGFDEFIQLFPTRELFDRFLNDLDGSSNERVLRWSAVGDPVEVR